MAATTAKKTTKSTAKKPRAAKKTTATKTTSTKKRVTKKRTVSAEERYKMTEVAAYYIAEQHNFQGNPTDYWVIAEAEINAKLAA